MALKKQKGPALTSVSLGDAQTIPARWLATLGKTVVKQENPTDVGPTALTTTLIESEVQQTRTDERSKFEVTVGDATGISLIGAEFDRHTGGTLPVVETIVVAGTIGTALQVNQTYTEIQPLNSKLSLKTTRTATTLSNVGVSWVSWEHVTLPRVLTVFENYNYLDHPHWIPYGDTSHTNPAYISAGGTITRVGWRIILTDYSAVRAVTYTEYFQSTPFLVLTAHTFLPTSIVWETPFTSGSVPPCLHPTVTVTATTGSTHPEYQPLTVVQSFPATSPTAFTGSTTYVLTDTQERFLGGWRRVTRSVTL